MDALALAPSERAFLEALNRLGVHYLVVGMSAALLQGARGVTEDVDLWFERTDDPRIGEAARAAGGFWISGSFGMRPPGLGGAGPCVHALPSVTMSHTAAAGQCVPRQAARVSVNRYPEAMNPEAVGTYPALVRAGGGYVWDEVLEYRVWCCPARGAQDIEEGNDYYYSFATYPDALEFARATRGAKEPLALILQREHINEPEPGKFEHVREERLTEWPVGFLDRRKRTERTIPDFLSPNAPPNRFDIIRGTAR
jgi:hypothetical protein